MILGWNIVWLQGGLDHLPSPSLSSPEEDRHSTQADISLEDSNPVLMVASPDTKEPTDFSDTTEEDNISEGET